MARPPSRARRVPTSRADGLRRSRRGHLALSPAPSPLTVRTPATPRATLTTDGRSEAGTSPATVTAPCCAATSMSSGRVRSLSTRARRTAVARRRSAMRWATWPLAAGTSAETRAMRVRRRTASRARPQSSRRADSCGLAASSRRERNARREVLRLVVPCLGLSSRSPPALCTRATGTAYEVVPSSSGRERFRPRGRPSPARPLGGLKSSRSPSRVTTSPASPLPHLFSHFLRILRAPPLTRRVVAATFRTAPLRRDRHPALRARPAPRRPRGRPPGPGGVRRRRGRTRRPPGPRDDRPRRRGRRAGLRHRARAGDLEGARRQEARRVRGVRDGRRDRPRESAPRPRPRGRRCRSVWSSSSSVRGARATGPTAASPSSRTARWTTTSPGATSPSTPWPRRSPTAPSATSSTRSTGSPTSRPARCDTARARRHLRGRPAADAARGALRGPTRLRGRADALEAMAEQADRIEIVSPERITDELGKLLAAPTPSIGLGHALSGRTPGAHRARGHGAGRRRGGRRAGAQGQLLAHPRGRGQPGAPAARRRRGRPGGGLRPVAPVGGAAARRRQGGDEALRARHRLDVPRPRGRRAEDDHPRGVPPPAPAARRPARLRPDRRPAPPPPRRARGLRRDRLGRPPASDGRRATTSRT